jgi:hypothetical protein
MNLLESYVKGYLLKEQINASDHQLIEDTMEELDNNLKSKSPSMSLETLEFNPRIIAALRDFEPLKDIGDARTKPFSFVNKRKFLSKSLDKFNITKTAPFSMPGLGFNPLEMLNSDKSFYTDKIQELIDVYEAEDAAKWAKVIKTLKCCLNLKKAIKETDLKVLGAGLYRVAVEIPSLNHFVIKIGLGKKGRGDCKKEIAFSDGRSPSRLEHQKNFPKIFTRSQHKSWYAIEKATFFNDKMFGVNASISDQTISKEIFTDLSVQFANTIELFDDILVKLKTPMNPYNTRWKLLQKYLYVLFNKDSVYKDAHDDYIKTNKTSNKSNKLNVTVDPNRTVVDLGNANNTVKAAALESVIRKIIESSSPDAVISSNIFKAKIHAFLKDIINTLLKHITNHTPKLIDYLNAVEQEIIKNHLNDNQLQKILSEIGSMFDQAVVTDIHDLHTGNMGFKKNDDDKWQLIFTDIDSK